jgi:hypothetical protein
VLTPSLKTSRPSSTNIRPGVRRVEWYFDFDAPLGAQELLALHGRCTHSVSGQIGSRRLPNLECAVAQNSTISSSMP